MSGSWISYGSVLHLRILIIRPQNQTFEEFQYKSMYMIMRVIGKKLKLTSGHEFISATAADLGNVNY